MNNKPDETVQQTPATRTEEGGGNSLKAHEAPLPDGIQAISVTHYRVGRYSYTNLDDAMAEHRRQSNGDVAA